MSGYIGTQPVPQATQTRDSFTATANQTSFATSGYTPEFLDVFLNGVKLAASDYTATNGSDVVLASGAAASDILEVVAYSTFEVLNPTFDGNVTFTGNASFGDNDKAIFGDGSDLQIYHDGSHSYISDQGAGDLRLLASNSFVVKKADASENMITANADGAVGLSYDGSAKLATTSTGIDVTGTLTVDKSQNSETNIELTNTNTGSSAQVRTKYTTDGGLFTVGKTSNAHSFGGDAYIYNVDNTNIRFATSDIERMRIDASGNVLVGKTSDDFGSSVGFEANANDTVYVTRSGGASLTLNRTSSDGDIALFRKDGSTVGSIGASGGDLIIGTGDTGVHFHDGVDSIIPWSVTAASYRNNAIDLGTASYSYRDLYLLGGIKFDTNGEFLDGYERGTFTPSVSGLTFTTAVGTYVKIGRVCHISINLSGSNNSRSADIYVSGLPFTASSGNYGANSVPLMEVSNISLGSGYTNMYGRINASDTRLQLLQSAGTAHANMNAGGGLNTGATLRASFTYQTNS